MCSSAMVWGMGYEQFWHCSWTEYFAFYRKFQIEQKRRDYETDFAVWWQGKYFMDALKSVYPLYNSLADPKKSPKYPYPKQPYLQQEKKRSKEDTEKLQRTQSLIEEHNLIIRAKLQQKQKPPE